MPKLLHIARKDAVIISRDRAALLVMLAMPLALIFILGSALGGTSEFDAKVAIVNEDTGDTGDLFVEGLTEAEGLDKIFDIEVREDTDEVRSDVEKGNLTAALIIPADLTEKIAAVEPVALEVLQDPGSQIAGGIWAGVIRAAVSSASAQIIVGRTAAEAMAGVGAGAGASTGAAPPTGASETATAAPSPQGQMEPVTLEAVTVKEVEATTEKRIDMISYYAAGMTGMFLLFGSMFGAFSFVKERREQTLARMLVSPALKSSIVGGKAFGIFLLAVGQFLILLVGTTLLFKVDWGENPAATVMIGSAEAFAAAGLAMTLAAVGKTERAIGGIGPALIMLFAATGGSMIPAEFLPEWLKPIQVISPTYWAVNGFLDLMRGVPATDVLLNVAAMLLIGVVLLAFGIWRLRYE